MLRGWETKRESFNVCLPREAIKINTSNCQAVLNFLGAKPAQYAVYPPPTLPPPVDPNLGLTKATHPPFLPLFRSSGNSSSIGRRDGFRRIHVHLPPAGPAITWWGAFVNVKGENPPLRVYDERLRRFHVLMISLRGKNSSELFIIEPRARFRVIIGEPSNYSWKNSRVRGKRRRWRQ